MEIIVFSANENRAKKIKCLADDILYNNKQLKHLSLHWMLPRNLNELEGCLSDKKTYLIIIDISCSELWENDILILSQRYKQMAFCILSDSSESFACAYNRLNNNRIYGFVNYRSKDCKTTLREIFIKVHKEIFVICGGILVTEDNMLIKVIPMSDVYYIETIKQTHNCTIYHKNGTDKIRADISKLIMQLDSRFEIIRSSTIANLSAVRYIKNRDLFFDNGCFCTITESNLAAIKRHMSELAII